MRACTKSCTNSRYKKPYDKDKRILGGNKNSPQIFNQIFIVLAGGGLEAGHFDGPDSAEKIMAEIYTRGPIVATMFVHYVMFYAQIFMLFKFLYFS